MKFKLERFLNTNTENDFCKKILYGMIEAELTEGQIPLIEQLVNIGKSNDYFEGNEYSLIKLSKDEIMIINDVSEENNSISPTRIVISTNDLQCLITTFKKKGLGKIKKILKL